MTITQADREAAADILEVVSTLSKGGIQNIRDGKADGFHVVQAFAAHREAERRAIVEWLREKAEPLPINGDKRHIIQHLANAVERGEDRT